MKLELNKISLSEQIANALRSNIEKDQFLNGMLPKEEDLAKDLNVSRGTIRSAMLILEKEDLIIRIKKKGTFVKGSRLSYQEFVTFKKLNLFFYGAYRNFENQNRPGFFGYVYNALLAEANRRNYTINIVAIENKEKLSKCLEIESAGSLIFGTGNKSVIKAIAKLGKPTVLIDHEQSGVESVNIDSYQGSSEAVKYLYNKGHRNFIFIDYKNNHLNSRRSQGVMDTLKQFKIPARNIKRVFCDSGLERSYACISKFIKDGLSKKMTAMIFYSSEMGFGGLKALQDNQFDVPEDFSLVSCGNISDMERPLLSTIDFDLNYLGSLAIDQIDSQIRGTTPKMTNELVRGFLVDRGSIKDLFLT